MLCVEWFYHVASYAWVHAFSHNMFHTIYLHAKSLVGKMYVVTSPNFSILTQTPNDTFLDIDSFSMSLRKFGVFMKVVLKHSQSDNNTKNNIYMLYFCKIHYKVLMKSEYNLKSYYLLVEQTSYIVFKSNLFKYKTQPFNVIVRSFRCNIWILNP